MEGEQREEATCFLLGSVSLSAFVSECLLSLDSPCGLVLVSSCRAFFSGSCPWVFVLLLNIFIMSSGGWGAGPATIRICITSPFLSPCVLPPLEKNGGLKGFRPKASLHPFLFSVVAHFCGVSPSHPGPVLLPPLSVGAGEGGLVLEPGGGGVRPLYPACPPCVCPAPATRWPSPGPSRTSCSSARSACWACPPPRPSPMPSSCC